MLLVLLVGIIVNGCDIVQQLLPDPIKPLPHELDYVVQRTTPKEPQPQVVAQPCDRAPSVEATLAERTELPQEVVNLIFVLARQYGTYDPDLQIGLIDWETGGTFDPKAVGHNKDGTSDHGLHQFNDGGTAQWVFHEVFPSETFAIKKLYDPLVNVKMGAWYINYLMTRQKDIHRALTAYNKGEGGMQRYVAKYQTSRSGYSRGVLQRTTQYTKLIETTNAPPRGTPAP